MKKITSAIFAAFCTFFAAVPAFAVDGEIVGGNIPGGNTPGGIDGGYVVWDPGMVSQGLENIKHMIGTAFNVGLWVFLLITGIYLVVTIIRNLFG